MSFMDGLQMYKNAAELTHSTLLETASKDLILEWSDVFARMPLMAILFSAFPYVRLLCNVCQHEEVKVKMQEISKIIIERQSEFSVPSVENIPADLEWLFEREAVIRSVINLWIQCVHNAANTAAFKESSFEYQSFLAGTIVNVFILYEEQVIDHSTQTWTLIQLISLLRLNCSHLTQDQYNQFTERIFVYSRKLLTVEEKKNIQWMLLESSLKSINLVNDIAKSIMKDFPLKDAEQFDLIVKLASTLLSYLQKLQESTETCQIIKHLIRSIHSLEEGHDVSLNYHRKNQLIELEDSWNRFKHLCISEDPEDYEDSPNATSDLNEDPVNELSAAFATFNPNITDF